MLCRVSMKPMSGLRRFGQRRGRPGSGRCRHPHPGRVKPVTGAPKLINFEPFDPASKMAKASVSIGSAKQTIVKGAFTVVSKLSLPAPDAVDAARALEAKGYRVLAVAAGESGAMRLMD